MEFFAEHRDNEPVSAAFVQYLFDQPRSGHPIPHHHEFLFLHTERLLCRPQLTVQQGLCMMAWLGIVWNCEFIL